ncbi:hypothetical protein AAF712_015338 [Marasmius tenuissimus]|uniref:Transcription factor domain-containing protein n=1 Tax=Marasmius tenuissimus TaxID=585030 RepID=A0ABR2ZBZ6_9AGAR
MIEGPCEYGDGRTQAQMLEKDIHRLEVRLRELQTPGSISSMELMNPYSPGKQSKQKRRHDFQTFPSHEPESTPPNAQLLIDTFFAHAHDIGFFLNIPRFRNFLNLPQGDPARPLRGLMSIMYLMGLRLAKLSLPTSTDKAQSEALVAHTMDEITSMPINSSSHPFLVVQTIQAELLLATYLFVHSRQLEGQYHLTRAFSLSIGARLNTIQTTRGRPSISIESSIDNVSFSPQSISLCSTPPFSLPHTSDPVVEGERVNAFWTAFTLCNTWDAVVEAPTSLISVGDGFMEVDTPWPMDMDGYEQGGFPEDLQCSCTVEKFLNHNLGDTCVHDFSDVAMFAKASVLFKRARKIIAQVKQAIGTIDQSTFKAFATHSNLVRSFRESLPPISTATATPDRPTIVGMNLVTHTLAHCSAIQLHSVSFDTDPYSSTQSLLAAIYCVQILDDPEVDQYLRQPRRLNPVMGVLWGIVCDVFLAYIGSLQTREDLISFTADALGNPTQDVQETLTGTFEKLMSIMDRFAPRHLMIRTSLSKSLAAYQILKGPLDANLQQNS